MDKRKALKYAAVLLSAAVLFLCSCGIRPGGRTENAAETAVSTAETETEIETEKETAAETET